MNYKQLGSSPLTVSTIGFGCMSLGNDQTLNDQLIHGAQDRGDRRKPACRCCNNIL